MLYWPTRVLMLGLCFCALFLAVHVAISQEVSQRGEGVTQGLSVGDVKFTYTYPVTWRPIQLSSMETLGSAVALVEPDALGIETPVAVTTLFIVEADRAIQVFQNTENFPFQITAYTAEPEPFVLDDRDAAVAEGVIDTDYETLIAVVQVEERLFLVSQTLSIATDLSSHRETIFDISQSVDAVLPQIIPTATATIPPLPTLPPQRCPYMATVTLNQLRVLSAEEARTGRDYGSDGDQITMTIELGPVIGTNSIDGGTRDEFVYSWSASLFAGNIRENVGEYSRHVCADDFGVVMYFVEDDSTPFNTLLTPLGEHAFFPLLTAGEPVEYTPQILYHFTGTSQDGQFDYELNFSVSLESLEGITTENLTPTRTPSNTPTATDTLTPSITPTPSSTFTLTPTNTFTPSNTPTPSDTPTTTPTFTETLTPSVTPTPSNTFTPSVTPTASDTYTPSRTPTPSDTATVTSTATATNTATSTYTPSATYTPSETPTSTLTSTITLTPTDTLTPSITPTATETPTPTPVDCGISLPSRLYSGMYGRVIPGGVPNRLRSSATVDAAQVDQIAPGEIFQVIGDPVCGDDYAWVEVSYFGTTGWTVESATDGYWLEPLPGAAAFNPDACMVTVNADTNKRSGPGTAFEISGQLEAQTLSDVIGKAIGDDQMVWYQLGVGGWMREDVAIESGLCDSVPDVEP